MLVHGAFADASADPPLGAARTASVGPYTVIAPDRLHGALVVDASG